MQYLVVVPAQELTHLVLQEMPQGYININTDYWTLEPEQARHSERGEPLPFGDGRPSEIGHGNVTPTLSGPGGVTISEAVQTTVLSFVQLRRLRFPEGDRHS